MNMHNIPQQPAPVFDDGQSDQTMRVFRLPGTNLTVVVMVPPDMQPVVGIGVAEPGEPDSERARIDALCNALDNHRYRDKPGRRLTAHIPVPTLTERQRHVMNGLRQGLPAKQIASQLGVNVTNIYRDIESVLKKTNSKTTEQAIYKLAPRWMAEDVAAAG